MRLSGREIVRETNGKSPHSTGLLPNEYLGLKGANSELIWANFAQTGPIWGSVVLIWGSRGPTLVSKGANLGLKGANMGLKVTNYGL